MTSREGASSPGRAGPVEGRAFQRQQGPEMSEPWYLGNDIVDLSDPRHAGKSGEERFLERVFGANERKSIRAAADPDLAVWARWAAKESAFKTVSKSRGTAPVFVHADYDVMLDGTTEAPAPDPGLGHPPRTLFGKVRWRGLTLPLRVQMAGPALHALTWFPRGRAEIPGFAWGYQELPAEDTPWRLELRPRFSEAEWACISHRASAFARLAARRSVADHFGIEEASLEIGCGPGMPGRRIPTVLRDGGEMAIDLTLSHHGKLLAWAFSTREGL